MRVLFGFLLTLTIASFVFAPGHGEGQVLTPVEQPTMIPLIGPIDLPMSTKVTAAILAADYESGNAPIIIVIDSGGGSVPAGNTIIDAMAMCRHPVYTMDIGIAASMAAIIFEHGKKRLMWPHAILMFHNAQIGVEGTIAQVKSELALWEKVVVEVEAFLSEKHGISIARFRALETTEEWLLAAEAIQANVADEIVTSGISLAAMK